LQQAGALVDEVAVYYTLPVASDDTQGQEVLRLLRNHQLELVTFTSSSTVRNFVAWLRGALLEGGTDALPAGGTEDASLAFIASDSPLSLLHQTRIASIGPITSQTARELGLDVDIEAKEFTIDGLVDAIINFNP
ncbi:MAG TPA: uroporphyrinogen-III synthase, partial [Ktedonobacteraceae bacterium]|nr:uroporphyrinogen-III synthase [Ktedonobacteraceae bacterium]